MVEQPAPPIARLPPWSPPPAALTLDENEVHVWRASLDLTASRIQSLERTLSPDECGRAGRFHFERDRRRFIVAHGLLRAILARYLGTEPGQLQFRYDPHGKPALAVDSGGGGLRFNLSHSHRVALYAVARGREVGIDVERIRTAVDVEQIAERFFSPREVAALRVLPPEVRTEAFFTCWTRKEAYVKARGKGLALPLDQFAVSLTPGEPAALLSVRGMLQETSRWSLRALAPGPGYVAALAVEGHSRRLRCWQWAG